MFHLIFNGEVMLSNDDRDKLIASATRLYGHAWSSVCQIVSSRTSTSSGRRYEERPKPSELDKKPSTWRLKTRRK